MWRHLLLRNSADSRPCARGSFSFCHFDPWQAVSRNGHLLLLLLITGLLAAGQRVVVAFVGPLLKELTGAAPRGIAAVFLLFGAMTLVGNVCASRVVQGCGAFKT
jgi:predicted MFS family arabinose efflux permease